ncbi:conserved Plasmodium protein, unknown function [Plasmodium chabaudi chabaudi]|uniref:PWI domain-containing protein n=1 Tax=Plasmodium chabaudi chabaudi TaxID=31271 RepID=A0A1D3RR72_PLACU|nr:conserved Plasmodium protein, unknown function [Plasmodium chabaudi chabaudi]
MGVLKFIGGINNNYEKSGKNEETETGEYNNVTNNKLENQEMEKIKYVSNNYKIHWRERNRIEKLDAKEKDLEKEFYKREKEWLELEEQIKKDTYKEWNKFMQIKKKDIAKLIELDLKGENEDSNMSSSKRRESRRSKRAKEKKLDEQDRIDEVKELEEAKNKPEQIKDLDTTEKEKEEKVEKTNKQNNDNTAQVKTKKTGFFATAFSYVFDNSNDKQDDTAKDDSEKDENENHDTKQLSQNDEEKNDHSEVEKENDESSEDKENNTNKKKGSKSKRKVANNETEKTNDKKKKAASENAQDEEENNDKSTKKVRGRNKKSSNTEDDENIEDIESLKNDPIIAYELETAFPKKRKGKNDTAKTIDLIKKSAKILEKIPSEEEDIFNYPIEWDILKLKDNIGTKLKPWIYKKITEYIGADEKEVIEEISNFFVEQILKETAPKDMLSEAEKFLDSDGKKFIINMYRLIIFEQLKIKNNM